MHSYKKKSSFSIFISIIILISSANLFAADTEREQAAKKKEKNKTISFVDYTHQTLSNSILLLTNRVDSFFGSERADDEANGSRLRLSWDNRKIESIDYDNKINLRMNFKFPALQEKLKFRFDRKTKKEDKESNKEGEKQKIKNSKGLNKAEKKSINELQLRERQLKDYTKYWNLRFEAGVRAEIPVNPFVNLRVWRPYSGSFWEFNPTHEVFVFWDDGFGTRHSFNIDFKITTKTILRIENSFTWTDLSDTIRSSHGPSLFHTISKRRAISFNAKAFGTSRPTYFINNYSLSMSYRQLIYKKWLFFEISPALSFPSTNDFERIGSIFFKLESVFGSI